MKVTVCLSWLPYWRKTSLYSVDIFIPIHLWTMRSWYPERAWVTWLEWHMQLNNILYGIDIGRISTNILCKGHTIDQTVSYTTAVGHESMKLHKEEQKESIWIASIKKKKMWIFNYVILFFIFCTGPLLFFDTWSSSMVLNFPVFYSLWSAGHPLHSFVI